MLLLIGQAFAQSLPTVSLNGAKGINGYEICYNGDGTADVTAHFVLDDGADLDDFDELLLYDIISTSRVLVIVPGMPAVGGITVEHETGDDFYVFKNVPASLSTDGTLARYTIIHQNNWAVRGANIFFEIMRFNSDVAPVGNTSCDDSSATGEIDLKMDGGYSPDSKVYSWVGPDGFTADTRKISGLTEGDYTVTVKDKRDCGTISKTYTVDDLKVIPDQPESTNQSVCEGEPTPTFTATGEAGYDFFWYSDAGLTSQIGAAADFTPIETAPGTYTYYVVQQNPTTKCTSTAKSVVFTIFQKGEASASDPVAICKGSDGVISVQITGGTGPFNIELNDGTNAINKTNYSSGDPITVSPTATTTYTIISVSTADGCDAGINATKNSVTVTVEEPPTAEFTFAKGEFCTSETDPSPSMTGTSVKGTFTATPAGLALNATTGEIDLSASTEGTYTIKNTVDPGGACAAVESGAVTVKVTKTPDAPTVTDQTFCSTDLTTVADLQPAGVSWFANATGGTALSSTTALATGTTYYAESTNGICVSARSGSLVTIEESPTAEFTFAKGEYCTSEADPTPTMTGASVKGTFTATPAGLAINAGTGDIDLSASTEGTYTIKNTVDPAGVCATVESAGVTVKITKTPDTPTVTDQTFCSTDLATVADLQPAGVSWFANATGGTALPSTTALATGTTYYAESTNGICVSARSGSLVTIEESPTAEFTFAKGEYCTSEADPSPSMTGTSVKGMFTATPAGLAINATTGDIDLSASTEGTYTIKNTVDPGGACAAVESAGVTVKVTKTPDTPTVTDQTFCSTDLATVADLQPAGVSWFANATGGTALSSTTALATGTTYYAESTNGICVSARSGSLVTIEESPTAEFTFAKGEYCTSETDPTPSMTGTAVKGTFTATPAGLAINATTGEIDLSASTEGTYTIKNTVDPAGVCATVESAGVTVKITETPDTPTVTAQSFCSTATATVADLQPAGVSWFANATGGTALPPATALVTGTTYYAESTNGICESARSGSLVTIEEAPTAEFTFAKGEYCTSETDPSPTMTGIAVKGTFTATPAGLAINATTGEIDLSASTEGTYTIKNTVDPGGACAAVESGAVTVKVTKTPDTPTVTGQTFCSTDLATVADLQPAGVSWFANATGGTALSSTTALATGTTYYAESTNGICVSARSGSLVTIEEAPTAEFTFAKGEYCTSETDPTPSMTGTAVKGTFTATPAGLAINATTGEIDLSASTEGTYTIKNTVDPGGACAPVESAGVTVKVTKTPDAPTVTDQTFCSTATATVADLQPAGVSWFANATGGTAFPSTTALVTGTTYYAESTNGLCVSARSGSLVTIEESPTAEFTFAKGEYCTAEADPSPSMTGTSVKGTFTATPAGLAIDAGTGEIDLLASTEGTYTIKNTVDPGGACALVESAGVTVKITKTPDTPTVTGQTFCSMDLATVADLQPAGVSWFANATGGTALPSTTALVTGTTYYAESTNGICVSARSGSLVTIEESPTAEFTFAKGEYCTSETDPTPSMTGTSVKGTFTATPAGLAIDATTGEIDLSASTEGTYTIKNTVDPGGACAAVESGAVTVKVTKTPDTPTVTDQTFCSTDLATVADLQPAGVSWFANATGGTALPSTTALATGTTYYAESTNGICVSARSGSLVTIETAPTAEFTFAASFCSTDVDPSPTMTGSAVKGMFTVTSGTGLSINASTGKIDLSASPAGEYTIINTVKSGAPCGDIVSTPVKVKILKTAKPVASNQEFCSNEPHTVADLSATAVGTISWFATATGGTALDGAVTLTNGTTYYAETVQGGCVSERTAIDVTVEEVAKADFTFGATEYCVDAVDPAPVMGMGASKGTFSVTPATGLALNSTTGEIDLSASTPGTYDITNTLTATAICTSTPATFTVTVKGVVGKPVFDPTTVSELCGNPANTTFVATATNSTSIEFSVQPLGAGTFAGNVLDWDDTFEGNATITATAKDDCGNVETTETTVQVKGSLGVPNFLVSNPTEICGGTLNTTFIADADNSTSIKYSISPAGAGTIGETSGIVSWDVDFVGTAQIKATASGDCGSNTEATHSVNVKERVKLPVFEAGIPSSVCLGEATTSAKATVTGSSTLTYSLSPVSAGGVDANGIITWAPTFVGTATVTATASGSCGADKFVEKEIEVKRVPVATATSAPTLCGVTEYQLGGNTPASGETGTWTILTGTGGSLDNANSPLAKLTGSLGSTYTLEWVVSNGACSAKSSVVTVTFNDPSAITAPVVNKPTQGFCQNDSPTVADLEASGANLKWFSSLTSDTPLASTEPLVAGDYYVASVNGTGCESDRKKVTVELSEREVVFTLSNVDVDAGDNFDFPIYIKGFEEIAGTNFTINYDPALVEPVISSGINVSLSHSAFGAEILATNPSAGEVRVLWAPADLLPETLADNSQLLGINFKAKENVCGEEKVTMSAVNVAFGDTPLCSAEVILGEGNVKVKKEMTVTLTASATAVCAGDNVTFTANVTNGEGTLSYKWIVDGTETTTTSSTYSRNDLADGDHAVSVTVVSTETDCLVNGTVASNSVDVNVGTVTPTISLNGETSICSGEEVEFTATLTNASATPTVVWFVNGTEQDRGVNKTTYKYDPANNDKVKAQLLTADIACSTVTDPESNVLTISTGDKEMKFELVKDDIVKCGAKTVKLEIRPIDAPAGVSVEWYKIPIFGDDEKLGNGMILNVGGTLLAEHDWVYAKVGAKDCYKEYRSENLVILGESATAKVDLTAESTTPCKGTPVKFTATPLENAGSTPKYKWFIDGTEISEGTSPEFNRTFVATGNVTVKVEMTPTASCLDPVTKEVTVNVQESPSLDLVTSLLQGCGNVDLATGVKGTGVTPEYFKDKDFTVPVGGSVVTESGTYYVRDAGAGGSCPADEGSLNVSVGESPKLALTSNTLETDCGQPADIKALVDVANTDTGANYDLIFKDPSSNVVANPEEVTVSGVYKVMVKDKVTDCESGELDIDVTINPDILRVGDPTVTNNTLCGTGGNGQIEVKYTGTGLEYSKDDFATVQTDATFTGLTAGNYEIKVRYAGSGKCVKVETVTVVDGATDLTVSATFVDPSSCATTDGSITVTATGGTDYFYTLEDGDGNVVRAEQNSHLFDNLAYEAKYVVKVRDAVSGCEGTTDVDFAPKVNVDDFAFDVTHVTSCLADNGKVVITSVDPVGTDYEYHLAQGATVTKNDKGVFESLAAGNYTLKVVNKVSGCESSVKPVLIEDNAEGLDVGDIILTTTRLSDCGVTDGTLKIEVNVAGNYEFSVNGGAYVAGTSPFMVNALDAGDYKVKVKDLATGCESDEKTATVDGPADSSPPAKPVFAATSIENICQGTATTTFTATTTTAGATLKYTLEPNVAGAIDANTGQVTWSGTFDGTATVKATATNSCGDSDVAEHEVKVLTKPVATVDPLPALCGDTEVTLEGSALAAGETGQWTITSGTGGTLDSPTASTTRFTGTLGTTYKLTWTVSNVVCDSDPVELTVEFKDPTTITPPDVAGRENQNFCGEKTVADLDADGINLKWYSVAAGGTPLLTSEKLVTGKYYVTSSDAEGCESDRIEVNVVVRELDFGLFFPNDLSVDADSEFDYPVLVRGFDDISGAQFTITYDATLVEPVMADPTNPANKAVTLGYSAFGAEVVAVTPAEGKITVVWTPADAKPESITDNGRFISLRMKAKDGVCGKSVASFGNDPTKIEVIFERDDVLCEASVDTKTGNIAVQKTMSVALTSSATAVCAGEEVTFTADVTGGEGTLTYKWTVDGIEQTNNTNIYKRSDLTAGDHQISVTVVSNSVDCLTESSVTSTTVDVNVGSVTPSIAIDGNTDVCPGDETEFTATLTNAGGSPVVDWYVNATKVATGLTYRYTPADGDKVKAQLTTGLACATSPTQESAELTMNVAKKDMDFIVIKDDIVKCAANPVTLKLQKVDAPDGITVSWFKVMTGPDQLLGTGITLTENTLVAGDLVYAKVPAKDCYNEFISETFEIQGEDDKPAVALEVSASETCKGESLTFKAKPTNGGTTPLYTWFVNGTEITGEEGAEYTHTFVNGGNQTIKVELLSSACLKNQTAETTTNVNVKEAPDLNLQTAPLVGCENVDLTAGVGNKAITVEFSKKPDFSEILTSATVTESGTYYVRNTGGGTCLAEGTLLVVINGLPTLVATNTAKANCGGTVDLTALVDKGASDAGTVLYTDNGGNTVADPTAVGVAGRYTLILRDDATGCESAPEFVDVTIGDITVNTPLVTHNTTCGTTGNGVIEVKVTGGTGILTYSKDDFATSQTSPIFSNLKAGTYVIKVRDEATCEKEVANVTITDPAPFTLTLTPTDVTGCGTTDGSVSVTVSKGAGKYRYRLEDGDGNEIVGDTEDVDEDGTFVFDNLDYKPEYKVFVTDIVSSCTAVESVAFTEPAKVTDFTVQVLEHVTTCTAPNGKLQVKDVLPTLAAGSYEYTLSGPATFTNDSGEFDNLPAGDYEVTVKNKATGCDLSKTGFTINDNSEDVVAKVTAETGVSNCNDNDGEFRVEITGAGNFEYSLDGSSYVDAPGTTFTVSNLSSGEHSLNIRNKDTRCTLATELKVTIDEWPEADDVAFKETKHPTACNSVDGVIEVDEGALTGTGPYKYSLDGVSFQASPRFEALASGDYKAYVLDEGTGCERISPEVSLVSANAITADIENVMPVTTCGGNEGSFTVENATGGTGTYEYSSGSTFQASNKFEDLTEGTYTVTVRDDKGCETVLGDVVITGPGSSITFTLGASDMTTPCGAADGSITVSNVVGGSGNFVLELTKPDGTKQNEAFTGTKTIGGLTAGTYSVRLVDTAGGCASASKDVEVGKGPGAITGLSITDSDPTTCDATDGKITVEGVNGGSGAYEYKLDGGTYGSDNEFTALEAKDYIVWVRDANTACEYSETYSGVMAPEAIDGIIVDAAKLKVTSCGTPDGTIHVTGVRGGVAPYTYTVEGDNNTTGLFAGKSQGTYTVEVKDANDCVYTTDVTITAPNQIIGITEKVTDVSVCEGSDGIIEVANVQGGSGAKVFKLYKGTTLVAGNGVGIFTGLAKGDYRISVTDANSCDFEKNVTVGEPSDCGVECEDLVLNVAVNNESCNGAGNGEIILLVEGAKAYEYQILNRAGTIVKDGDFTARSRNLTAKAIEDFGAGTYTVNVRIKDLACSWVSQEANISRAVDIKPGVSASGVTCDGNDGFIKFDVSPTDVPDYTFEVLDGSGVAQTADPAQANFFPNLKAGSYTVKVSKTGGCETDTWVVTLSAPDPTDCENDKPCELEATLDIAQAVCNGDNATATVRLTGERAGHSYRYVLLKNNGTDFVEEGTQVDAPVFRNLIPGDYKVKVTDLTATETCEDESDVATVDTPNFDGGDFTAEVTAESCTGNDGKLQVKVLDATLIGTFVYELLDQDKNPLSPAKANETGVFDGLGQGTYFFKVSTKGAASCELISTNAYVINSSRKLTGVTVKEIVGSNCFGGDRGKASFEITGGTGDYQYNLTGQPTDWKPYTNMAFIEGLQVGKSVISFRSGVDDNCSIPVEVDIPNTGTEIKVEIGDITPAACDNNNGSFRIISVTGGEGGADGELYSYRLNGVNYPKLPENGLFNGLTREIQHLTVIDGNGCEKNVEVPVGGPDLVYYDLELIAPTCDGNGKDGKIVVKIDGNLTKVSAPFYVSIQKDGESENIISNDQMSSLTKSYPGFGEGTYHVFVRGKDSDDSCPNAKQITVTGGTKAVDFEFALTNPNCSTDDAVISVSNLQGDNDLDYYVALVSKATNEKIHTGSFTNDIDFVTYEYSSPAITTGDYELSVRQDQGGCVIEAKKDVTVNRPLNPLAIEDVRPDPNSLPYDDASGNTGAIRLVHVVRSGVPAYEVELSVANSKWVDINSVLETSPIPETRSPGVENEHVFKNLFPGVYVVTLTDGNECSVKETVTLGTNNEIWIPNMFTPNGDNKNDQFYIRNMPKENEDGWKIIITNRWGREVYSSDQYREGQLWDGGDVPDGVYFYHIQADDAGEFRGYIEVFRGKPQLEQPTKPDPGTPEPTP
ncbi:Ig-like domain-containing protein [Fulvitalea axinellae]|uniref:Ig-like domain-containing protein n=1 Tax=Fulvitalea axinellae TaxID=1182444 RepID=UPI0030CA19D5